MNTYECQVCGGELIANFDGNRLDTVLVKCSNDGCWREHFTLNWFLLRSGRFSFEFISAEVNGFKCSVMEEQVATLKEELLRKLNKEATL